MHKDNLLIEKKVLQQLRRCKNSLRPSQTEYNKEPLYRVVNIYTYKGVECIYVSYRYI